MMRSSSVIALDEWWIIQIAFGQKFIFDVNFSKE